MVKSVIENICKAEEAASNMLLEAEKTIRRVELDGELKIEKLKEKAETDLRKEIKELQSRAEEWNLLAEENVKKRKNKAPKADMKDKTAKAKKYIMSEFLKRI